MKHSHFWSTHFFEDVLLLSISRKSLEISLLDDTFLGNFAMSNSIILVEDLRKWNRCFEIFLIDLCDDEIGNENIAGKY